MKKINCLEVNFENCTGVKIGAKDIVIFQHNNDEILLEVTDNANSEYIGYFDKLKSPLQRLTDYRDITSIIVCYDDGTKEEIMPEWYYENEWDTPQENKYQINKVIDHKHRKVIISKEEYIKNRMNELSETITAARDEYKALFKDLADILNNK